MFKDLAMWPTLDDDLIAAIDAHEGWCEACVRVEDAYRAWLGASGRDAGIAYGAYCAALDVEQACAEAYAEVLASDW